MRDDRDFARVREDIKRSVLMDQVVEACGLGKVPRSRKITSPFNPNDKTPSCHIYQYDWYDFSTGQGGDQIRFVQEVLGLRYTQALLWLSGGLTGVPRRSKADRAEPIADFTREWGDVEDLLRHAHLTPQETTIVSDLWAYAWDKWGLNPGELHSYDNKLTFQGYLLTPHWNRDWTVVRGVKTRNIYTGEKGSWSGSKFMTSLYRPSQAVRQAMPSYLVEGESDAWVLQAVLDAERPGEGNVFALPAGAGGWRDHWISQMTEQIYITFDDDDAGWAAAERAEDAIIRAGHVVDVLTSFPHGRLAEDLREGWRPW